MIPLDFDTFNSLFTTIVNPKLLKLMSSVSTLHSYSKKITEFVAALRCVSGYLDKNNPANILLKLILSYNTPSHIKRVKFKLKRLIEKLNEGVAYDEILTHVNSIKPIVVTNLNVDLKQNLEDFKEKMNENNKSLEENIKRYIQKINSALTKNSSSAQNLFDWISENLTNLKKNQDNLDQFSKYTDKDQLIKPETRFTPDEGKHFQTIFKTHEEYQKCLKSCFSDITPKLTELKKNLQEIKNCSEDLTSKLEPLTTGDLNTTTIQSVLESLQSFKTSHVDKLNEHMDCVNQLEQIRKHIETMKSTLSEVKDKVVKEAENYIKELADITIKKDQVEEKIKYINGMNDCIIARLKVAKSAIEFHELLKTQVTELKKLNNENGVKFEKYDISEYLTNSSKIHQKLEDFKSKIKEELNSTKEEIKKSETEIQELIEPCDDLESLIVDVEDELISAEFDRLKSDYTRDIENITKFIGESLDTIKIIQRSPAVLEKNKKDSPDLNLIKSKVCNMSELKDATTRILPEVRKEIENFLQVQKNTKDLIEGFRNKPKLNSLEKYSKPLEQMVAESESLVDLINFYIGYLNTIEYVEFLINWIKTNYLNSFQRIRVIVENFKAYLKEITRELDKINDCLYKLKCAKVKRHPDYKNDELCSVGDAEDSWEGNDPVDGQNHENLHYVTEYVKNLKVHLRNIEGNVENIRVLFDKVKRESPYIDQYKCEFEKLAGVIECYTSKNTDKKGPEKTIIDYLKSIRNRIKETLRVKQMIIKQSNVNKVEKIYVRLRLVEQNIGKLEFAIERVVGNAIESQRESNLIGYPRF